ncbi:MAG: GTP-binding protein [Planctomycetes bacterium]|nr:GTP-binding protein [Planctomycetota bacterium]
MKGRSNKNDTIAAITTPLAEGGIGVIQVTGSGALDAAGRVFRRKRGEKNLLDASSGDLFYGVVSVPGGGSSGVIDEAIVCVWRAEDSLTGEDLVEISCHGGPRAVRNALNAVTGAGAREANWAEFLVRGRENNRMDFLQVEAHNAIIRAKTRLSVWVLVAQQSGLLSGRFSQLETDCRLLSGRAKNGVLTDRTKKNVSKKLALLVSGLEELLGSSSFGLALTSPQRVSIAGAPNVGKSTLFNTLLKIDRSIVHHLPGTTRDYINEYLSIRGVPFEMVDAAGLREADQYVEKKGVERALDLHRRADRVILVFDGTRGISGQEWDWVEALRQDRDIDMKKIIPVINKIDLGVRLDSTVLDTVFECPACLISAIDGRGLELLENALIGEDMTFIEEYERHRHAVPVVFTERQRTLLSDAWYAAARALDTLDTAKTLDKKFLETVSCRLRELRCGGGVAGGGVSKKTSQEIANAVDVCG